MEDYVPNSFKSKEETARQKKVEKVVNGKVITKPKSGFSKITNNMTYITYERIWSLRRYCIPNSEICVIYTFFGVKPIIQYIICYF